MSGATIGSGYNTAIPGTGSNGAKRGITDDTEQTTDSEIVGDIERADGGTGDGGGGEGGEAGDI